MRTIHTKKEFKEDPLASEISKIVNRKKKVVKPGYKKKRAAEVEKLRRKAKRAMIQEDIKRQKKERARLKQIEKRGNEQ